MMTDLSSFRMSANCVSQRQLCTGGPGTVRQLHTLNKTMLQQAIFVPPGYTSLLYAHGHEDNSCPYNTALFKVSVFCMLLLLGSPRHMLAPVHAASLSTIDNIGPN